LFDFTSQTQSINIDILGKEFLGIKNKLHLGGELGEIFDNFYKPFLEFNFTLSIDLM